MRGLEAATRVAAGARHTLVLVEDGAVWAFGAAESGQLGLGDREPRLVPSRVDLGGLADGDRVAAVAAGGSASHALCASGSVFEWGGRARDAVPTPQRLGAWGTETSKAPPLVCSAVGVAHFCAVDAAGMVVAWGRNTDGELGVGDSDDRRRPVRLSDGSAVADAAAPAAAWVLRVSALAAWDLPETERGAKLFGAKQDPYVAFAIKGRPRVQTKAIDGGGSNCKWAVGFDLPLDLPLKPGDETVVEVSVWNEDLGPDTLIGRVEGGVRLSKLVPETTDDDDMDAGFTFTLSRKGKAGEGGTLEFRCGVRRAER